MMASQHGHLEVVRLLLESGADKDLANNDGRTARIIASQNGHHDGSTALMMASQNGHLEVVRLLIKFGADMNLATNDGQTAGMLAPVKNVHG